LSEVVKGGFLLWYWVQGSRNISHEGAGERKNRRMVKSPSMPDFIKKLYPAFPRGSA
jgi:hypothetical protein